MSPSDKTDPPEEIREKNDSGENIETSQEASLTSTNYHDFLLQAPTVHNNNVSIDPNEVDEYDPNIKETIVDSEVNYEIAKYFESEYGFGAYSKYVGEKRSLLNHTVNIKGKNGKKSSEVTWRVCEDIPKPADDDEKSDEVPEVGVRTFPFNNHPIKGADGNQPRINTLHLLLYLWPGNMKKQLDGMNEKIQKDNVERKLKHKPLVNPVSLREMGTFLGILLVARLEGKKGSSLWVGEKGEGYGSKVDMSSTMMEYRHKQIRSYFEVFFADHLKEGEDAWWKVVGGIESFNKRRRLAVNTGKIKTPDESMSAFCPQTTPHR